MLDQKNANLVIRLIMNERMKQALTPLVQSINELVQEFKPQDPAATKVELLGMMKESANHVIDKWIEKTLKGREATGKPDSLAAL